jgi:UDP-N-acetyl-D-mannosaminuronic acid dehydrogenase
VKVDPDLVPLEAVLEQADILVVGAPHKVYRALAPRQPTVDVWNVFGRGVVL